MPVMCVHYRKTKTIVKKKEEKKISCSSILCILVNTLLDVFPGIFIVYK